MTDAIAVNTYWTETLLKVGDITGADFSDTLLAPFTQKKLCEKAKGRWVGGMNWAFTYTYICGLVGAKEKGEKLGSDTCIHIYIHRHQSQDQGGHAGIVDVRVKQSSKAASLFCEYVCVCGSAHSYLRVVAWYVPCRLNRRHSRYFNEKKQQEREKLARKSGTIAFASFFLSLSLCLTWIGVWVGFVHSRFVCPHTRKT